MTFKRPKTGKLYRVTSDHFSDSLGPHKRLFKGVFVMVVSEHHRLGTIRPHRRAWIDLHILVVEKVYKLDMELFRWHNNFEKVSL